MDSSHSAESEAGPVSGEPRRGSLVIDVQLVGEEWQMNVQIAGL